MKVKYFNPELPKLTVIDKGDWIDVRVNEIYICPNSKDSIKNAIKNRYTTSWWNDDNDKQYTPYMIGDVIIMRLGFAAQLPINHEAEIKPRSSTFADYGLLLVNSVGCIDESYCGDSDEWLLVYYATRSGTIERYDRIGQFRINEKMPSIQFVEVKELGNKDRNGFGSTGNK